MEGAIIDTNPLQLTISAVIAADFNNDGKLDLLVEGRPNNNSQMMRLLLYLGNYTHLSEFLLHSSLLLSFLFSLSLLSLTHSFSCSLLLFLLFLSSNRAIIEFFFFHV
jgi:ABC-type transport system involved in multi-copper enzyme maturation permease subunit